MRGKPEYTYVAYADGGITPAYAGKTHDRSNNTKDL